MDEAKLARAWAELTEAVRWLDGAILNDAPARDLLALIEDACEAHAIAARVYAASVRYRPLHEAAAFVMRQAQGVLAFCTIQDRHERAWEERMLVEGMLQRRGDGTLYYECHDPPPWDCSWDEWDGWVAIIEARERANDAPSTRLEEQDENA